MTTGVVWRPVSNIGALKNRMLEWPVNKKGGLLRHPVSPKRILLIIFFGLFTFSKMTNFNYDLFKISKVSKMTNFDYDLFKVSKMTNFNYGLLKVSKMTKCLFNDFLSSYVTN